MDLLREKLAREFPLTDEDLNVGLTKLVLALTPKESSAMLYEQLRNELAKACVTWSEDEELWELARLHGALYRSLDLDNFEAVLLFEDHCINTAKEAKKRIIFLREKRWMNS